MNEIFLELKIPVSFIEENGQVTAHCPVLDIATCGKNFDIAKKMFEEFVAIFFEELYNMGTMEEVLLECGFKKVDKVPNKWEPPKIIGSITEDFRIPCRA